MAGKLVIVESPAKARTLNRILGRSYSVKASLGHVRDLPRGDLGVDVDKSFIPKYVIPPEKKKLVGELKKAASKASSIYLATDPDREGEAISWHLTQATGLDKNDRLVRRVVFHEITNDAVQEAFRNPRSIDMNLVNAQQARRILDRLVGYKLSPLLWRKVQRGLSAGRVQSVAVRMIVDRERDIQDFVPQEYWVMEVELAPFEEEASFKARLFALADGTKLDVGSKDEADRVAAGLEKAEYAVKTVVTKQVARQPAPPFITSTLQQEAWQKLHFTAGRTMAIAQQLYEGLPLGKEGSVGLITYMRTDSTHVAASAISEAREFIADKYGAKYLPPKPRSFARKSKWAQEAHEAIRPTQIYRQPDQLKAFLDSAQLRLYELIWKRMVASQMSAAQYNVTNVEIEASNTKNQTQGYLLRASSSVVKFPGFMVVYSESRDEDDRRENSDSIGVSLPKLRTGDKLTYLGISGEQCFTQPPPRYTEATLIKALEQKGIGRPSTYAPILSTIQGRDYVNKVDGKFRPTELGITVTRILTAHFPRIVDPGFTAQMEEQLDEIAQGKYEWIAALQEFYPPFRDMLDKAWTNLEKVNMTQASEETCPKCGRPMVIKVGRFGRFLACSGYPDCKTTLPYMVKTGVSCPLCGGDLVKRISKKKKVFYGCSKYPKCQFTVNRKPMAQPCPDCGNLLVQYRGDWAQCVACKRKVKSSETEKQKEEAAL
ncbi:MAG: DNA topoisomerase I [Chloroflexi bacterium RBG_13_51_36]|nr:MAG: DNA topoisomerase I [Chloroflexi bacterium RBG_13_51_36]